MADDANGKVTSYFVTVGQMVERGEGTPKDEVEAACIYRELADKGDSNGEVNLGRTIDNGAGGTADRAEAMRRYRLAAKHGNSGAQEYLKKLGESW